MIGQLSLGRAEEVARAALDRHDVQKFRLKKIKHRTE
jgi:hypothetical protein